MSEHDPLLLRDQLRTMSADASTPAVREFYLRWIAAIDEQLERARSGAPRSGREAPPLRTETN
jgi:hypothetical protein